MSPVEVTAGRLAPAGRDPRPAVRWLAAAGLAIVLVAAVAAMTGWDVLPWLRAVWRSATAVSPAYLLAALGLQTLSIALSGLAWYGILDYAYPGEVGYLAVLAACATGTALNTVMPASGGTVVTMFMLVAVIPGATMAGVLAGAAVEKLFFGAIGALLAAYLFVSVGGSFGRKFGAVLSHPWATAIAVAAVAIAVAVGAKAGWKRLKSARDEARRGGRILSDRRAYLTRVALPQLGAWLSRLAVIAVLLAAYGIPVSPGAVLHVVAGNSLATNASVTPGGAGVTQAFNVASLHGTTSAATAGAYSVGQQLLTSVWDIVLAVVLVGAAFGRTAGRQLFADSYREARNAKHEHNARPVRSDG
jgi:uncharacterized membrane protein YbhN (UPF0104 family)